MGAGAMTGRAAGYCAGYSVASTANPVGGRGRRFWSVGRGRGGWGRGLGFGAGQFGGAPPAPAPDQELASLKQQAAHLQGVLEDIAKRIEELAAEAPSK